MSRSIGNVAQAKSIELSELGQFLRKRRSELQPEELGLHVPARDRRRVKGLRREEVAQLVAISTDYYTRIEQGRVPPSPPVLRAIIAALRLDESQADYLYTLNRRDDAPEPAAAAPSRGGRRVRPQIGRLLRQIDRVPALVFNNHLDILDWNPLAAALLVDFGEIPVRNRNYAKLVFTDPVMRSRYPDWTGVARTCVAVLRMNAADDPTDPALARIVGDLSLASPDFAGWWGERRVAHQNFGTKVVSHPDVGDMSLDWDSYLCTAAPGQQIVMWTADPDTESFERLERLRALTAERAAAS